MSRLIILSEVNNLKYFLAHGVVPSEFYTDLEAFSRRSVYFRGVTVLCVFQGTCNFSKKGVVEMCEGLRTQLKETGGEVHIISDTYLPLCTDYYRYKKTPMVLVHYNKWKADSKVKRLQQTVSFENAGKTTTYLREQDYGVSSSALEKIRSVNPVEKDLIALIRRPDIVAD